MSCGDYERICRVEFRDIQTKLDRLDEAIRGNGRLGVQLRLDRLEGAEKTRRRVLWIVTGSTLALAAGSLWKVIFGG